MQLIAINPQTYISPSQLTWCKSSLSILPSIARGVPRALFPLTAIPLELTAIATSRLEDIVCLPSASSAGKRWSLGILGNCS